MAMLHTLRGRGSHMRCSFSLLLAPREAGDRPSLRPFLWRSPGPNIFAPQDHDRGYLPHNTLRTLLPGGEHTTIGPGPGFLIHP